LGDFNGMPTKKLTVEQETQIGIVIDMLERLEGKVDIAESARREREKSVDELVVSLKHSVKGNAKPGLEKDMLAVQANVRLTNWIGTIIGAAVLLDLISHYIPK
jgi:hypothetical protein